MFGGRLKAYHALDVPFVFDTIDAVGATRPWTAAHELARSMSSTWAAFARSGKPDNPAIPHWPSYSHSDRATLILERDPHVVGDHGREQRILWKEITHIAT